MNKEIIGFLNHIVKNYYILILLIIVYIVSIITPASLFISEYIVYFSFWLLYFSIIIYVLFPVFNLQIGQNTSFNSLKTIFYLVLLLIITVNVLEYKFYVIAQEHLYSLIALTLPFFILPIRNILKSIMTIIITLGLYFWFTMILSPINMIELPAIIPLLYFLVSQSHKTQETTKSLIKNKKKYLYYLSLSYLIFIFLWLFKYMNIEVIEPYSFHDFANFIFHLKLNHNIGYYHNYFFIFLYDLLFFSLFLRIFRKLFIPQMIYFIYVFIKVFVSLNSVFLLQLFYKN